MLEDYLGLIYHGTTKQKLGLPYDVNFKITAQERLEEKEQKRKLAKKRKKSKS